MKRLLILPIVSLLGALAFCTGMFSADEPTPTAYSAATPDNTIFSGDSQFDELLDNSVNEPIAPSETGNGPVVTPEVTQPEATTSVNIQFTTPLRQEGTEVIPEIEAPVTTVVTTTKAPVTTTVPVTTTTAPTTTKAPQATTTPTGGILLNVPVFYQFDSRWKNTYIGNKTIGEVGCITTCISMVYSYHTGSNVFPNTIKSKLSYSNNDLAWGSLTRVDLTYKTYNGSVTNDLLKTIYNLLKQGKPVIIGGTTSTGANQHWVVITGYPGTSTTKFSTADFTINDPGSQTNTTLKQFLDNGAKADRTYIKRIIY